ncbi:MAG: hypothetical protein QOJ87_43, partial [Verrucomicrobiota bacterium]
MLNDIRYGLRQLIKHPAFTIIAVLTLALGIGANTAIFSVVNAVLLKPLPFPAADQLIAIGMTDTRQKGETNLNSLSYPDFFDFRDQSRTLASSAVYRDRAFALTSEEGATSLRGVKASAEFLDVLGIKPQMGRGFVRDDDEAGGGAGGFKVIISHEFWQKHFAADPNVIGRPITLDRRPYTVIGVMPAGFQFPISNDPTDFYVSISEDAANPDGSTPTTKQRGNHSLQAVARLKQGATIEQAQSDLAAIAAALTKQYPDSNTHFGVLTKPLREEMIGDVRTALYVLFGAVVCVLLIANANVANLLLARASARGKEIALRAAMGASRLRIIRQLLTESVLLSGLGGGFGLLLALWGTETLVKMVPQNIPRISNIQLDAPVLVFTLLVS